MMAVSVGRDAVKSPELITRCAISKDKTYTIAFWDISNHQEKALTFEIIKEK